MISGDLPSSSLWGVLTAVIIIFLVRGFSSAGGSEFRPLFYVFPIVLLGATQIWLNATSKIVPEPYLVSSQSGQQSHTPCSFDQDEIFHIPQAQKYCEGRFNDWDDKITTPPGL